MFNFNNQNNENPKDILFSDSIQKRKEDEEENNKKSKLLNILGDKATPTDVLYGTSTKLEQKIKNLGLHKDKETVTGGAAMTKGDNKINFDEGFDRPIWDIKHYDNLSKVYDKELGDFLQKNTDNPKRYSNNMRHQYVSAIFARNLGEKATKIFGELNELRPLDLINPMDSRIDKINNEIGRNYAKMYPNLSRDGLLKLMLKEYAKNEQSVIQKMQDKTWKQKKIEKEYL